MNRRRLLKAVPAAGLLSVASWTARAQSNQGNQSSDGWRTFEVVTKVEIVPTAGQVMAWVPLPLSQDTDWFQALENDVAGNFQASRVVIDPTYRAAVASATFANGEAAPTLTVTSKFRTRDRQVALQPMAGMQTTAAGQAIYLQPTDYMPTDGIVREKAQSITRGARSDVDKARAVYDWVVENTERNAKTRGCGIGNVKAMLESNSLNGKCADLNALFVALTRASGVPARDVYGVRVADSKRGYKSLGKAGDITRAQHCRAEFYAQGIGWVPVDPADVRKVVLEETPGLTLNDDVVKKARTMLWGGWEGNWLAYNYAHDVRLPGSGRAPLAFLMYPQAEGSQGRFDSLDPDNFKYRITSREIT